MLEILSEPWPWYIGGPLVGLMVPLLLLAGNKRFGISSTLKQACSAIIPTRVSFFKEYDWRKDSWNLVFAGGILLGAFLATEWLGAGRTLDLSSDTIAELGALGITDFSGLVPKQVFNWGNLLTGNGLVFMVLGGFLVGFGARYGGGCTSGHAIMGLSMLQVASLVAVVGFFAGGLFVTHFLLPYLF
ncbi:MAG: YeeE/YedE thiosulfate transporter family protein [Bacteroidota bacterium]